ncbi:MAG: hypothetical protein J6D23_01390 [Clostridia bacterium]|nr:hypothetical protein [Clostridia bacterium]
MLSFAFYEDEYVDDNNPCVINCSKCNVSGMAGSNPVLSIEYANGYDKEGTIINRCLNSGCTYKETTTVVAIFICLGYSAPEDGGGGIAIGFTVNNAAISEYKEVTGKTLKYGVFAVLKDRLGENDIFDENGNVAEGVVNAEITSYQFTSFELKITGFTDTQKDTKLAMGAYVAVTDGETTEYSYMQGGDLGENEKYCFDSFNDIIAKLTQKVQ